MTPPAEGPLAPPLRALWPYGDAALTLAMAAGLAVLVGLAMALRRSGVAAGTTRTLVHAVTALAVAVVPWGFASPVGPMLLAAAFAAVNAWAVRRRRLGALHDARPDSYGTVAMPVALVLLGAWTLVARADGAALFAHARVPWSLAWAVLAIADPVAGAVGRRFGRGAAKSWAGSGAFFAATALVAMGVYAAWGAFCRPGEAFCPAGRPDGLAAALRLVLAAAAVGTACEWLGRRGWDNVAVVLGVFLAATLPEASPGGPVWLPVPAAAAFAWATWRGGLLSGSGAVAAGLFAWLVLEAGSAAYLFSGVGFFLLSSLLSRWGRRRSADAEAIAEKGHRRDAYQVAANGAVGAAALAGVLPTLLGAAGAAVPAWPLWLGAFAAATADTWGTELGTRFGGTPRLVTTGRKVRPGTSGGISAAGLLGGLAGAFVVGVLFLVGAALAHAALAAKGAGPFFAPADTHDVFGAASRAAAGVRVLAVALAAGLAGSLFDSVLGATVQRRFRRPDGTLTEKPASDGVPHERAGGWRWMTNDTVNFFATLAGAVVGAALAQVLD